MYKFLKTYVDVRIEETFETESALRRLQEQKVPGNKGICQDI